MFPCISTPSPTGMRILPSSCAQAGAQTAQSANTPSPRQVAPLPSRPPPPPAQRRPPSSGATTPALSSALSPTVRCRRGAPHAVDTSPRPYSSPPHARGAASMWGRGSLRKAGQREKRPPLPSRWGAAWAQRPLAAGPLVRYDWPAVWRKGRAYPLATRGHARDGKRNNLQIEFGLLCDRAVREQWRGLPALPLPQRIKDSQRGFVIEWNRTGQVGQTDQQELSCLPTAGNNILQFPIAFLKRINNFDFRSTDDHHLRPNR